MAPSTPSSSLFQTRALVSYIGQCQTILGPFSHVFFPPICQTMDLLVDVSFLMLSVLVLLFVLLYILTCSEMPLPSYEYLVVLIPKGWPHLHSIEITWRFMFSFLSTWYWDAIIISRVQLVVMCLLFCCFQFQEYLQNLMQNCFSSNCELYGTMVSFSFSFAY